jgi:hypothetical protein
MPGATPHIRKVDFVPVGFSRHGDSSFHPITAVGVDVRFA